MIDNLQTRGLCLSARYRQGLFEGEACLLVYDEVAFDDIVVSGDIKRIFEKRANVAHIFIVAPFVRSDEVKEALLSGAAIRRANPYFSGVGGTLSFIEIYGGTSINTVVGLRVVPLIWDDGKPAFGTSHDLPIELKFGWLFDLFDKNDGLVTAPLGVHFKKGSGKHSDRFLRTANVLTTSASCGLLALFALASLEVMQPRRIFVDTSPLISVAFAAIRIAHVHGAWEMAVPVRSFSSYGGLQKIGRLSQSDVLLVSASTSGSLVSELMQLGARESAIVTMYFLSSDIELSCPKGILCDLTSRPAKGFGYLPVKNYKPIGCLFCAQNFLAADLEGDQFLLQARQNKLIQVLKASQSDQVMEDMNELAKHNLFGVTPRIEVNQPTLLSLDGDELLRHQRIRSRLIRNLKRFCPVPLRLIVRVGVSDAETLSLLKDAGLDGVCAVADRIDWTELGNVATSEDQGTLVLFGGLDNHSRARTINATLRTVAPRGVVTYLSGLTLADSPEQLNDIKTFLRYGENGPDTFTFHSAVELAFPLLSEGDSAWSSEFWLLEKMREEGDIPDEFLHRLESLETADVLRNQLFLPGKSSDLAIQNDFVFLNTREGRLSISQADIFFVVANVLCTARFENRPFGPKPGAGVVTKWVQSVYGQVLLSPANFSTFNDAILKAAFLRAANKSELLFSVDSECSENMCNVILAEISAWKTGNGDALPEFLISLASKRLRLEPRHTHLIKAELSNASLPRYLARLGEEIAVHDA